LFVKNLFSKFSTNISTFPFPEKIDGTTTNVLYSSGMWFSNSSFGGSAGGINHVKNLFVKKIQRFDEGTICRNVKIIVSKRFCVFLKKNENEKSESKITKLTFNPKYDKSGYFFTSILSAPFRGGL